MLAWPAADCAQLDPVRAAAPMTAAPTLRAQGTRITHLRMLRPARLKHLAAAIARRRASWLSAITIPPSPPVVNVLHGWRGVPCWRPARHLRVCKHQQWRGLERGMIRRVVTGHDENGKSVV